jgi:hypothetical protein
MTLRVLWQLGTRGGEEGREKVGPTRWSSLLLAAILVALVGGA